MIHIKSLFSPQTENLIWVGSVLAFHTAGLQNKLTHASRIRLTSGSLHDLANDCARCLNLTGTNLIGNIRHGRQSLLNGGGERTIVRDHSKTASLNDLGRLTFASKHILQNLTGDLIVDLTRADQRFKLHHRCGFNSQIG